MNYVNIVLIVIGSLLITGVVSSNTGQECVANDKLIDVINHQQKTLTDMLAESKKQADDIKKKYEQKLDELNQLDCKTKNIKKLSLPTVY